MNEGKSELRERMMDEAERITGKLREDPSTMAVILSGPLALGAAAETDKLYLAVITDRGDGVIEHHFLDEGWDEVKRPIEVGKFPLAVARHLLENGYSDMVSYKSLEAFRCGTVLWERDGAGTEAVEGAKRHIPERTFIGESLHGAVSALDDAVSLLESGDFRNAVIVAREAATKAVGMVAGDRMREAGISLLEAAAGALPPEQYARFEEIMGLTDIDPERARASARQVREFAVHALMEIGVDPKHILHGEVE